MSAVYRQPLSSLTPSTKNVLVIGVIINSLNVKTFESTRSRYNCGERSVWTFILRDSKDDIAHVTVWGSVQFVKDLTSKFHIGSVVEVLNPKIIPRHPEDRNELFVPSICGPYLLNLNEGSSLIQFHDSPKRDTYTSLLKLPTRSLEFLKTLQNVLENLDALRDTYVDVLVVVTFLSAVRQMVSRDGKDLKCRSFEATDNTTDEIISFMLWDDEWINKADCWSPKKTVLLLTDARVAYDNFRKKVVLSIARKTLIIEDPDVPQAEVLRQAVKFLDFDVVSSVTVGVPDPESITTVMTIKEISNKLSKIVKDGERLQFATILKAYVMELNADSAHPGVLLTKCALCKKIVQAGQDSCMNLECPAGNGSRVPVNILTLNLRVNLKDNTGYLIGCRLVGEYAERALGCTASEFQAMMIPERAELKWKYVLEKCDVRVHILGPTSEFPNAIYNILSITRIEAAEEHKDDLEEDDEKEEEENEKEYANSFTEILETVDEC